MVATPETQPERLTVTYESGAGEPATVVIERTRVGWIVPAPPGGERAPEVVARLLEAAAAEVARHGGGRLEFWIEEVREGDDAGPEAAGFSAYRDLWQLRCPLPAAPTDVAVRPFTEADAEDFLAVNNRAFHWHPEQGGMTLEDLRARQAEPWYDPDGFLLHDEVVDGRRRLAGFCWTKIHSDHDPPLGEIYVIAVDPDFHGRGLGEQLTLAGLQWLAGKGLRVGMLYVESDNHPANRVYERIGFRHHHTNRAYERRVDAA